MIKHCKTCGSPVTRYVKARKDLWDWCSNKCMSIDPEILVKKANTNKQRFGGHPMNIPEMKKRHQQTFIERYGVDNIAKSNHFKVKSKETFLKKYGVDNPSKNSDVIEKIRQKAVDRYATDKDVIMKKRRQTNMSKFGFESNKQTHIPKENLHLMKDIEWLHKQHFELKKSIEQIATELGISPTPIFYCFQQNNVKVRRHQTSQVQIEIINYIKSIYSGELKINDRQTIAPKELDIYIPEFNLAIEVNGVYWHSEEKGKDKSYHVTKTDACEKQNIHLIHIYDVEWGANKDLVKSKLAHYLGKSQRIYARHCVIKEVSNNEARVFLNTNHIQGSCPANYKIGLYHNNELIAISTFGRSRFNKQYPFELLRYCSKLNHTVIGGLSKILKYANKSYNINNIISYADRRYSTLINGNLYDSVGFKFLRISEPNYKYFKINKDNCILHSRNQFQKHKLKDKLEMFDASLSEYENMSLNGYYRIWDCGNLVYKWSIDGTE